MTDHQCPYDEEFCEVGSMCPKCTRDHNVYREY